VVFSLCTESPAELPQAVRSALTYTAPFTKQRCFELSFSQTETDPNVSDPPMKTLTPAEGKKLDEGMKLILHSFRFPD
jgi:hypothetical protein